VYAGLFDAAERATLELAPGRRAFVHVARGAVTVNGEALETGDALKVTDSRTLTVEQGQSAEVLVFDLPG
jgi:redox-sensitive bicupin YhaK (pirin superfamily)